jgi:hypothetical protein
LFSQYKNTFIHKNVKVKAIPQQSEVAQGVPGRLRPRIFVTFGTTRVVGRQPYAPADFTPGEIPGTHFQRLSRPQGTWFRREPRKKSPVTPPGIDPGTVRLVAQCLKHYATPGPHKNVHKQNKKQLTIPEGGASCSAAAGRSTCVLSPMSNNTSDDARVPEEDLRKSSIES